MEATSAAYGVDATRTQLEHAMTFQEEAEQHPWHVLNATISKRGDNWIKRVVEMCKTRVAEDTTIAPGIHLVTESLPSQTNEHLTSSWWAAEQSQGSASIPQTQLWMPVVLDDSTFNLFRLR